MEMERTLEIEDESLTSALSVIHGPLSVASV